MDYSSIELKVISARDLKCFNFFRRLSVYAVVSLFNDESKKKPEQERLQRQKTPVDRVGDGNPEWNHAIHFDLKEVPLLDDNCKQHLFLKFDLRSDVIGLGNRTIGKVQVPVFKDLIDGELNGTVRFLSYQVRTSDGKPNGVLNFSCKVNDGKTEKKKVETEYVKVNSSSGIHFSSDTEVHYPTLEAENQLSRDISYPSLDDVLSPSPRLTIPSPKKYHWIPGPCPTTPPSLLPHLPPAGEHGMRYHPCHSFPSAQIPVTYWYKPEWMGYRYTLSPN
ncbi:hypothetical protein CJ030_MR7G000343 [Morella rubra]|uniref:C2 domain-containing protein n=1 Tax=Morella rubra TaxID=262757 RepID=A0A6A1UMH6_9ROSI|nr:hypothetical protein CJ030_MR0G000310 [Morella rubra]KAB1207683.1 hypothetical protein CJ030_MR7G000343 [Morella rubra]